MHENFEHSSGLKIEPENINKANKTNKENSPANSTVSLVCAIASLPVADIIIRLFTDDSMALIGWVFLYFFGPLWLLAFSIWIVCGIKGLKSQSKKMAIASLIIMPVGLTLLCLVRLRI